MSQNPVRIVIPARLGSTRLPRKPLLDIAGLPLIVHVCRRAQAWLPDPLVATDSEDIVQLVQTHGFSAVLTDPALPSGSDRVAAAAAQMGWSDDCIIINLQGDEPLTPVANLQALAACLVDDPRADVATLAVPIQSVEEFRDPNVVKLVRDRHRRALYFSRSPIPWDRDSSPPGHAALPDTGALRHLGLYAYRLGALRRLVAEPASALEGIERLEQLRWLEHGAWICVADAPEPMPAGVDTSADLERLRSLLESL